MSHNSVDSVHAHTLTYKDTLYHNAPLTAFVVQMSEPMSANT